MKFLRKTNGKLDANFIIWVSFASSVSIANITLALTVSKMPWFHIACAVITALVVMSQFRSKWLRNKLEKLVREVKELEALVAQEARKLEQESK